MNQKQFSEFFKKIEVLEYGNLGYIYFYGTNLALCRKAIEMALDGPLEDLIAYCSTHNILATIVLTKPRFWKAKQQKLNKQLQAGGCHMDREQLISLYRCNEFVLSQSLKWQKNWEQQPVFKAALDTKNRVSGLKEFMALFM